MKGGLPLIVTILLLSLAACSSSESDLRYLDSRVLPALEVPPDLTAADTDSNFELPAVFSGESSDTDSAREVPVLANVESVNLEGYADFYWLSLDAPIDDLYQLLKDFWASEGFTLSLDEPVIGIMETSWTFSEEGARNEGKGFFARLFSSEELAKSQDQFRTRISKDDVEQGIRIYISHRGTDFSYKLSTREVEDDFFHKWIPRQSDTELEVEMLSRLMIYLGLRRAEIEQQLENVKLFTARASFHTNYEKEESYLLVQDSYSRTWYRTLHQLERLKFEVANANYKQGTIRDKGVIRVNTDVDVEVKKKGFFALFSNKTETAKKQIALILAEETHNTTRISIETPDGETDNSAEGIQFLSLLYQHIK